MTKIQKIGIEVTKIKHRMNLNHRADSKLLKQSGGKTYFSEKNIITCFCYKCFLYKKENL